VGSCIIFSGCGPVCIISLFYQISTGFRKRQGATAAEFSDPEIVFRKGTRRIAEILPGEKIGIVQAPDL